MLPSPMLYNLIALPKIYLVKQFNAEAQRRKDAERTKNSRIEFNTLSTCEDVYTIVLLMLEYNFLFSLRLCASASLR
jgi:hypothetical protein